MNYRIGVDLGASNVRVALGDERGKILSRLNEKTDINSGPNGISLQIIRLIRSLTSLKKILSVGIGSAGPLNLKEGAIINSTNMGFDYIPLVKPLRETLKVPIYLANDCVAGVVGEKEFGNGKKIANLVYVTISTGIGCGIFVDNHLLIGKDGNAHEAGHLIVPGDENLVCGCGSRNHWEAHCSGANTSQFIQSNLKRKSQQDLKGSLLYEITKGDFSKLSSKDLFELAKKKDTVALEIVKEMGRFNAIGFGNINNVYDPQLITIGGAIALSNSELILRPIVSNVKNYTVNRIPKIKLTELGEDIVLYGALVLDKYVK